MTIVTVGKQKLQVPVGNHLEYVEGLREWINEMARQMAERCIETSLDTEVERYLGRKWYARRKRAKRKETQVYCSRCRNHQRQDFYRNGHYERKLLTLQGRLVIQVPQLKCGRCGGNVRFAFQTIQPRQRVWDDVLLEAQAEYGRGQSYRQIKLDLDEKLKTSFGLRTLNQPVLRYGGQEGQFAVLRSGEAPPVVRVDGIWITVKFATSEQRTDRAGRKRVVKLARRIPILVAQGVWPDSGRKVLLAWKQAEGEDSDSWQAFLEQLYLAGLTPENGLRLLVADGAKGFRAAYENVYWMVPFQRCVFHKLRNVARRLRTPAGLDDQAARAYRSQFLDQARQIWRAPDEKEARQRYQAVCQAWQDQQPKALQILAGDFDDTLTFYAVQEQAAEQGQHWPARYLRTTSALERTFREFRRRYRNAFLFHSEAGAQATTALIAARFS